MQYNIMHSLHSGKDKKTMYEINVMYKPELKKYSDLYFGTCEIQSNHVIVKSVDEEEAATIVIPLENIFKIVFVERKTQNE